MAKKNQFRIGCKSSNNKMRNVTHNFKKVSCFYTDDGVKYYDPSTCRFPGEWMLINCDLHDWAVQTDLSYKPTGSDNLVELPVDNKKIKLASKNVYNITRLTYNDSGEYICDVLIFNSTKIARGEVIRRQLIVLKQSN